jgi:hypothetical protein
MLKSSKSAAMQKGGFFAFISRNYAASKFMYYRLLRQPDKTSPIAGAAFDTPPPGTKKAARRISSGQAALVNCFWFDSPPACSLRQ